MADAIPKIALIVAGCALILFREPFADSVVGFQIWSFHMPFGKREVKITRLLAIVMGVIAIMSGLLGLFGILK